MGAAFCDNCGAILAKVKPSDVADKALVCPQCGNHNPMGAASSHPVLRYKTRKLAEKLDEMPAATKLPRRSEIINRIGQGGIMDMEIPNNLIKEAATGNVVLFIGAGLSMGAGLPGWSDLVRSWAQEIGISENMDPLKVAQYYELRRGRNALIRSIIESTDTSRRNPTKNHYLLANLPIQTWITTNYDDLIELTFREIGKRYQKVVQDRDLPYLSADVVTLVKMHGDREQPDSIIITEQDYFTYFKRYPLVKTKLDNLLTEKTFLFIGYSISDPDFRQIYSEITFELEQHQRMAYAFMFAADELTVDELRARHISVVNIPLRPGDDRSTRLREVLEELVSRVERLQRSGDTGTPSELFHERYQLAEVLASTGLSTVYKAHDALSDAPCIVKHIDLRMSPDALDVVSLRFDHPRIAKVISFWHEEESAFVVQHYYDGWTLDELLPLNEDGFGQGWVEMWAQQLMEALTYLHARTPPVIHRDLRPPNILILRSGKNIMLLDWSSAILYKPKTLQTSIGTMEGYTAPEQLRGLADPRSDIYMLGALLYCLLAGNPPPNALQRAHGAQLEPKPLQVPLLGQYIERMLSLDREDRFQSVETMLSKWREDQKKTRVIPDLDVFFKGVFPSDDSTSKPSWLFLQEG